MTDMGALDLTWSAFGRPGFLVSSSVANEQTSAIDRYRRGGALAFRMRIVQAYNSGGPPEISIFTRVKIPLEYGMSQIKLELVGFDVPATTVVPAASELVRLMDLQEANALDKSIDRTLERSAVILAQSLIELGTALARMHADKGYKLLGYMSWENYLASKRQYGRTYLSYLLKLGQAGDLKSVLERKLGAAQLVEYAKHTDYPDKVSQLVAETWDDVRNLSIRQMGMRLKQYAEEHSEMYKKPGKPKLLVNKRSKSWRRHFERQLEKVDPADRAGFLADLEAFLEDHRILRGEGRSLPPHA